MQTILVIDDDEETRRVLQAALARAGYFVFLAQTGAEGVRLFRSERIGLVIVDIWMPENDGLETIMELRRVVPEAKIICDDRGGERRRDQSVDMGIASGGDGELAKPIFFSRAFRDCIDGLSTPRRYRNNVRLT